MSENTRTKEINGAVYTIVLPPVRKVMPLCTQLATLFTPILGTLTKDVKTGGMEQFGAALQSLDPDKIDALCMRAVEISKLHAPGNTPIFEEAGFNQYFNERRDSIYQVTLWALWECVRDFFPRIKGLDLDRIKMKVSQEFASQMDGQETTG